MDKQEIAALREWAMENVMDSAEAARYLGISRQAVTQAASRGSLTRLKEGLYLKPDLDAYCSSASLKRPKTSGKKKDK